MGRGTVDDTVCREKCEIGDAIWDLLEIALSFLHFFLLEYCILYFVISLLS
jgi:hypothetical protein